MQEAGEAKGVVDDALVREGLLFLRLFAGRRREETVKNARRLVATQVVNDNSVMSLVKEGDEKPVEREASLSVVDETIEGVVEKASVEALGVNGIS